MKITLEVTITGLDGWDAEWDNKEGVQMVLADVEAQARHAIADNFGILLREVEVEANFDSGN